MHAGVMLHAMLRTACAPAAAKLAGKGARLRFHCNAPSEGRPWTAVVCVVDAGGWTSVLVHGAGASEDAAWRGCVMHALEKGFAQSWEELALRAAAGGGPR